MVRGVGVTSVTIFVTLPLILIHKYIMACINFVQCICMYTIRHA